MPNILDSIGTSYMLVGDITVSSATTSVSFTGLNISKDDDYLLVSELYNPTGSASYPQIYINGNNTSTNYYTQFINANNTTVSAGRGNNANITEVIASAKTLLFTKIKLTNNGYAVYQNTENRDIGGSSEKLSMAYTTSTFTSISITSLLITSGTPNSLGIGSRFQLYKLVAEKVADIIVSTATTSVDITGLNIDKGSEYCLVSEINNTTASNSYASIYVNGTTTPTSYYRQALFAFGSSVSGSRDNFSYLLGFSANQKGLSIASIKLTNNGYFVCRTSVTTPYGSAVECTNACVTSTFTATSLTSLTITASVSNAIGVGSRFQLYKMK